MSKKAAFRALKCNSDGHITIAADLRASGMWGSPSASISASAQLTIEDARQLAASIIAAADAADAKLNKKKSESARKAKWRAREIAAGRMVVMTASQVLAR